MRVQKHLNFACMVEKKFCRIKEEPSGHATGCKLFHRLKGKKIVAGMGVKILKLL